MSGQRPSSTADKQQRDFPTRFLNTFGSHMYGAAKQANLPEQPKGIVFFSTEVKQRDSNGKPLRYRPAHLGRTVILTQEQADFIAKYLGLSEEPFGVRK